MRKIIMLGGLVALLGGLYGGFILWRESRLDDLAAPPQASAPATESEAGPAASGPVTEAHPPEVVGESADSETALESIIPRRSEGHAQDLHKSPTPVLLGSSAVLVLDAASRKVLLEKNADSVLPMASITKVMTAMVVLEARVPLDQPLTITEDDIDKARMSRSRLRAGTVLSRDEALHLALMSSENRAAHALGRTYPGGLPAFVAAMNRKAQQLGMANTTYVDPTGLSEKNRTTARDLATLVLAASGYPLIREYSTTPERRVQFGQRALLYRNSNALARDASWDIQLQKTGYIVEAGHCVVQRVRADNRDLVMVLLDAGDNRTRNADARRLREFVVPGFEAQWAKAHPPAPKAVAKAKATKGKKDDERKTAKATGKKSAKDDDKSAKPTRSAAKNTKGEKDDKPSRVSRSFKREQQDG